MVPYTNGANSQGARTPKERQLPRSANSQGAPTPKERQLPKSANSQRAQTPKGRDLPNDAEGRLERRIGTLRRESKWLRTEIALGANLASGPTAISR